LNILLGIKPFEIFLKLILQDSQPTVCVTGAGAGVDSAWEQEKLEARKMLVNSRRIPSVQCTQEDRARSFYTRETGA